MAEILARARYSNDHTFDSSGVWAMTGWGMTDLAREVIAEIGIEDDGHIARDIVPAARAREPDVVYVMTEEHLREVAVRRPDLADRTMLLDPDGSDIADPYGGTLDDYRVARDHILEALEARLA